MWNSTRAVSGGTVGAGSVIRQNASIGGVKICVEDVDGKPKYCFEPYVIDVAARELRHAGEAVVIQSRVFDLLVYLAKNHDRLVDKDELQDAVWPGRVVTEASLTRAVMKARKAVGDDANQQAVIKTLHGHGYRFVAELEAAEAQPAAESSTPNEAQDPAALLHETPVASQNESQQRKLATVLYMSIVNSESITQRFDPEDVMAFMDAALPRLADPVQAHGGRVIRFTGDGFLALFGAPVARENDPEMGVRAGLGILAEAHAFVREAETQWNVTDLNVRVGISTGLLVVGGDTEAENAIMGAAVNLAEHLENAAEPGMLLISDHTYAHVRGVFDVQLLEPIAVKGLAAPLQVYAVDRAKPRAFRMQMRGVAGVETRMVGREAELLKLQSMFREATEDAEVHVVTIVGDAGVGKSRLLYELEKWIELLPEGIYYFRGRSSPEDETTPYGLVRRIFTNRFDILESDSTEEVREKFRAGMVPTIDLDEADLVGQLIGFDFSSGQAVETQLGSQSFGEVAGRHLTKYLRSITTEPTVIFLEDIHWADDSSLDLIGQLVTAVPDSRLLVVCLARPSLFERRPNWGEGHEIHTRVDLAPLSRRASRTLVGEIFQKAGEIPVDLHDMIVEGAEGNPFYVEELIKMLIEEGVVDPGEEFWRVEAERLPKVRIPLTLAGILQARLDSLPPAEKILLQRASIAGRRFWRALVAGLTNDRTEAAQVDSLLDDIRRRELILRHEHSAFETTDEYVFKHALLRDVTYETVLLKVRRVYHAQVAQWLENTAGDRVKEHLGLIARHYRLAGEKVKAAGFLQRLGEESLKISAFRDAARSFERALSLLPEPDDEQSQGSTASVANASLTDRAMLLVNLGTACNRIGDYLTAIEHFEQGLSLARKAGDPQAEIEALSRLAQVASERGAYETAQRSLDEVLVLARKRDDLSDVAFALSMQGTIAWKWGNIELAEKCCYESMAIYKKIGDNTRLPQLFNILGILATIQENFDEAEQNYEQGLDMARELEERQLIADLLSNSGYLHHHCTENLQAAKRCYRESLSIAREIGHRNGATSTSINLGQLHATLGEHQLAWKCLRDALIDSVAIGAVPLTLDALVGVAQHQVEVERYELAAELLGLALGHSSLQVDSAKVAESVLDRVRMALPAAKLEVAMERGKRSKLEAVVEKLVAEAAEIRATTIT